MVLYHRDGRVVIAHERYLEHVAQELADNKKYINQVQEYNQRNDPPHNSNKVYVFIEHQKFKTTWGQQLYSDWEMLSAFNQPGKVIKDVDRAALRLVSSQADDHFRYKPGDDTLRLPVRYPRVHLAGQSGVADAVFATSYNVAIEGLRLIHGEDSHMAYIRPDEIVEFIIPWLAQVAEIINNRKTDKGKGAAHGPNQQNPPPPAPIQLPPIGLPDDLLGKIHLYNAMLQLGLLECIKKPLIDALVLQMYRTNLVACHLNVLEMTVGRFYSRGLPILDPVLNHFAGTYAFRRPQDRRNPGSAPLKTPNPEQPLRPIKHRNFTEKQRADGSSFDSKAEVNFGVSHRQYLVYEGQPLKRKDIKDTYLIPPVLPVLGHTITHWTGVRKNGSTAAAITGFPLNIGKGKRMTHTTPGTRTEEEVATNHLVHQEEYLSYGAGHLSAPRDQND